jgi:hypothetical protein
MEEHCTGSQDPQQTVMNERSRTRRRKIRRRRVVVTH